MSEEQLRSDEQIVAAFLRRVEARQAADQREKRQAASRQAKASVSLEGFTFSAEYDAAARAYDDSKITFEELLAVAKRSRKGVSAM